MWRKYFYGALVVLFYVTLNSSCKDPAELGLEVLPASDQLSSRFTDTTTLHTKTVKEDSLRSVGVSYQLLGSCNDPVFGRSDASFYTQVYIGLLPQFGGSSDILVPDSIILSLTYAGYYGDTTSPQVVHVYRLTDDILADTAYYTTKVFANDGVDLAGSYSFYPKPKTKVSVNSADQPAQLRIPLALSLADTILSLNGQSELANNPNWIAYFKGLYLQVDPENATGKGAISYFDLSSAATAYSKMTLYFKRITPTDTIDSLHYDFNLSFATKVSHHEHEYYGTATDVGHQLMDSSFNDSLNYLQSLAGVKTKITFPYLENFIDSGSISVNKAELEITIQAGSADFYTQPSRLFLVALDASGNSIFLTDYLEGVSYFDGSYYPLTRTYKFNIARQLQRILDNKVDDYGFYLVVSGATVLANRIIIGSAENPTYPMKLHFYYTKLH